MLVIECVMKCLTTMFRNQTQRNAILIANYELTPNMADHKNHLMEKMGHEIS